MELGLAYFFISTVVTLLVEQVRKVATGVNGTLVNLVAWAIGTAATWVPIDAFADLTDIESRLTAGLVLAGASSLIAEIKGVLTNTKQLRKATLESIGRGDQAYVPKDGAGPSLTTPSPVPLSQQEYGSISDV